MAVSAATPLPVSPGAVVRLPPLDTVPTFEPIPPSRRVYIKVAYFTFPFAVNLTALHHREMVSTLAQQVPGTIHPHTLTPSQIPHSVADRCPIQED